MKKPAASAPRLRIAFVAHRLGTDGGIENVVLNMVRHSLERGDEVAVVADRLPPELEGRVRFERAAFPARLPWALRILAFAFTSRAACRRLGPGWVLNANNPTFAPAQLAVAHSVHTLGVRAVLAEEASPWRRLWFRARTLGPLTDWLSGVQWRSPGLQVAVALSQGIQAELESLYPGLKGRIRVVPNGFDPARFRPLAPAARAALRRSLGLAPAEVVLLFVGKDFHRKGLEFVLRALPLLPLRVRLLVLGRNGDVLPTEYYVQLARSLGVEARVAFLGHQGDVAPYFQASDAFVFPTLYESFCVVSAEAMGAGLPFLGSHANGIDDFLEEGVNGAFIRRDGADIAAAVRRWILPPSQRLRLRKGALARSGGMRWSRVMAEHRRLWMTVRP